jgi:hypothetical protein
MKARILLCGVLLVMTAPLGASSPERLSIRVSPSVAIAPADLFVRAMVEASNQNRAIEIIAESGDFYRSSETPLNGDKAPRTTHFQLRGLPGGEYSVTAVLKGANDEPIARTFRHVRIVSTGFEH